MIKAKTVPVVETAAGIPVDVDIQAAGTGSIMRDGREIEQTLTHPTTNQLSMGTRLLHLMDQKVYEIVQVGYKVVHSGNCPGGPVLCDCQSRPTSFKIERLSNGTKHDATLEQLKLCTFIFTEHHGDQRTS